MSSQIVMMLQAARKLVVLEGELEKAEEKADNAERYAAKKFYYDIL